jgi:phospholipid-binding lipoprotein MlaA
MSVSFLHRASGWRLGLLMVVAIHLAGCATPRNPVDPFEPFNRSVMRFNDDLDTAVLKPVATTYRDVVPRPVRVGVSNFFGNLSDVWSTANNALQLKPKLAGEMALRVGVNTLFGFGGIIDVATDLGLERHSEDFGQTLARWGVPAGPYLMLPVLGPFTLRDAITTVTVDMQVDPVMQIDPTGVRAAVIGLRLVDLRADLLRVSTVLDEVALDRYTFTRDAYLQRRRALVNAPPPQDEPDPSKE